MKVNKGDILITRAGPMNRTGVACVVKDIHYNLILSDKTIRINMSDELFDMELSRNVQSENTQNLG